jgi:CO/xanthine dehydrogenase Mo-binding subunit
MKNISRSTPKVDHIEKVSGSAKYVSDIKMDDMHYAKTVRSTKAHAKIKQIKIPVLPEGYIKVDIKDVPNQNYVKMIFDDWKIFADDHVNYIGEPIMLIVGKDRQVIDQLIEQIEIEYEELKPIFDFEKSVIQKAFQKGNPEKAFQEAHEIYESTYETGYQEQAYIEPQGFIGYLEQTDKVTLIGSIQCPYYVKNAVIDMLQCDQSKVRVIQAAVGGAFGGKEEFPSLMACQLALACLKLKKPIKMIYEREEDMLVTTKRHPSKIKLKAAISKTNTIEAIEAHVSLDGGAYIGLSGVVLSRAMLAVTSAYQIDKLKCQW